MQGDTFTSTPRRRKKANTNRLRGGGGGGGSIAGASNVTGNLTILDESAISNQQNSHVVVPVQTQHVASTTTTTMTSLIRAEVPLTRGGAATQVIFSTCQMLHPGQHTATRAVGSNNG